MNKRHIFYFYLSLIFLSFFCACTIPAKAEDQDIPPGNLVDPLREGSEELEGIESEVPPSKIISEQQLKRFLAVIFAMSEAESKNPDVSEEILSNTMLNALNSQGMKPAEYQEISDAIYYAGITLKEQSMQLKPEADDAAFEEVLKTHTNISEDEKQAMRESRSKNQGWYKGTALAPAQNLALVDRYWKELYEGPRQDIRYYDDFLPEGK